MSELGSPPERGHDRRSRWLSTLWLLASLVAAGWIVWSSRDDIVLLAESSMWVILAMIAMHAVSILCQSERFRIVLQLQADRGIQIAAWTRLYVRGRLFSSLVPQSGHVYRGLALRQDHGTSPMRYVSSLVTQTWLAVLAGLVMAALIIFAFPFGTSEVPTSTAVLGLGLTAFVVGAAPIIIVRLVKHMPARVSGTRLARLAKEAVRLAAVTVKSEVTVGVFLTYVLVGLLAGGAGMAIAFSIVGEDITWATGVALIAFVHLGNVVSITPANLGIQELGLAALAALFGYLPASGVVASVVVRLSNVVALALLVLIFETEGVVTRRSRIH